MIRVYRGDDLEQVAVNCCRITNSGCYFDATMSFMAIFTFPSASIVLLLQVKTRRNQADKWTTMHTDGKKSRKMSWMKYQRLVLIPMTMPD